MSIDITLNIPAKDLDKSVRYYKFLMTPTKCMNLAIKEMNEFHPNKKVKVVLG